MSRKPLCSGGNVLGKNMEADECAYLPASGPLQHVQTPVEFCETDGALVCRSGDQHLAPVWPPQQKPFSLFSSLCKIFQLINTSLANSTHRCLPLVPRHAFIGETTFGATCPMCQVELHWRSQSVDPGCSHNAMRHRHTQQLKHTAVSVFVKINQLKPSFNGLCSWTMGFG